MRTNVTIYCCFFISLWYLIGLFVHFMLSIIQLCLNIVQINSETCNSTIPYNQCSKNGACGCFPMVGAENVGVCGFLWKFCSHLQPCGPSQECSNSDHICIHHSRCNNHPICYPLTMINENICPPISISKSFKFKVSHLKTLFR